MNLTHLSLATMMAVLVAPATAQIIITDATTTGTARAPLEQRLDAIFDDPKWDSTWWGVVVQDLETSKIIYNRNAEKSFAPASNMKLYTTAAALSTLGADYKFETKIYATGTTDSQGMLHGDIIVVGSGDPSISGRYLDDKPTTAILAEWADAITSAGIKGITGRIIGDDDIFDDSPISSTWVADYLQEWYAAENSGLAINENCWDVLLTPTDPKVTDLLITEYYTVDAGDIKVVPNDDRETSAPAEEEARLSIDAVLERRDRNRISLSGTIEADSAPVKEWGSIHNGTLFTVTLLKEELERKWSLRSGNRLLFENKGLQAVDIDDLDKQIAEYLKSNRGSLLHTHVSPPLSKILAIINKPSQNFYADMLLKGLGAEAHELGSFSNGEKVVKDMLTTAGVDSRSLNMSDGSGLSRYNRVEPRQTLALLNYMYHRPDFAVFEASLPIMGLDGTLRGRMKGTMAEGNVKAKTGTIGGVRALSGYMTANGRRLAFSMMANNYYTPTSAATEAQDQAVLEIMK